MTKKTEASWLAGLLLMAFLLRGLPALYPHFWFDEIFTIALTRKSFGEILRLTAADMHPPLYYDWVKCFAAVGGRLGGPFATLPFLRLASIVPGMAACILGWWIARRSWGRFPALWTLGAFAVAPALTYYSVDLRSYSMLHALLLGALCGFLRVTDARPGPHGPALALLGGCALAAFYTHSLSTLYLGAFGLIFMIRLARAGGARRELARRGAILAGVLAIGCAPWIRLMFGQTALLNAEKWLGWATWRDLRATCCWYLPLGPWSLTALEEPWPWLAMPLVALAMLLLAANAWRNRRLPLPAADAAESPATLGGDRLLIDSAALVILPLLVAFVLSYFRIAKVFLGNRYNLIPAPFLTLVLVGLILRIAQRRRRVAVFGLWIAIPMACSLLLFRQRVVEFDIIGQAARAKPEIMRPDSRLVWNNPNVLPWLGKCHGARRIGSLKEILDGRAGLGRHETLYLLTHLAVDANYSGLLDLPSFLLKEILIRRGIHRDWIPTGAWDAVWRLTPADVPPLAAAFAAARERIQARRRAIPGGQVLLADQEVFYATHGWGPLMFGPELLPERWTEGSRSHLSWRGPSRPGPYRLKLILRRPHPFPEKFVTVRYRLPGQREWKSSQAGPGRVTLEGLVWVRSPGERLRLHLETPTWIPAQCLGNTLDDRRLGIVFEALELHPAILGISDFQDHRRQTAESQISFLKF